MGDYRVRTHFGKGLVRSVRGSGGGFELSREPANISLKEVLHALEGSFDLVDCVGDKNVCDKSSSCITREVWCDLSSSIEVKLASITLGDLVRRKRDKEATNQMFFI